jgi:hypothetical protein
VTINKPPPFDWISFFWEVKEFFFLNKNNKIDKKEVGG